MSEKSYNKLFDEIANQNQIEFDPTLYGDEDDFEIEPDAKFDTSVE